MLRVIIFCFTLSGAIKFSFSVGFFSPIINIKNFIRPFEDCLVHLTTFKVFARKSNFARDEKDLEEQPPLFEIEPVKSVPIVLSSYRAVFTSNNSKPEGYNPLLLLPNNKISNRPAFFFNPTLTKGRTCYLELYSLSFRISFDKFRLFTTFPNGHHDQIIPWVYSRNGTVVSYLKGLQEEESKLFLPKHNIFHGIILSPTTGAMGHTFEFAENLKISNYGLVANIPITLYHILDNFKPSKTSYIISKRSDLMPFDLEYDSIKSIQMLLAKISIIYEENLSKSRKYVFTIHAQVTRDKLREVEINMTTILQQPKFIKFERWMLSDVILLHAVFPNSSYDRSYRQEGTLAWVTFQSTNTMYVSVEQVGLQFITCDFLLGSLSIIGYFSAFQIPVWGFLGVFIIASVLALKTFDCLLISCSKKCHDVLLAPISILLEQGVQITNQKGYRPVIIVWIGMGVILSNAYKGQNITLDRPTPSSSHQIL